MLLAKSMNAPLAKRELILCPPMLALEGTSNGSSLDGKRKQMLSAVLFWYLTGRLKAVQFHLAEQLKL